MEQQLDKFKCKLCTKIRNFVFECANHHLVCEKCVDDMPPEQRRCSCRTLLLDKKPNPIEASIEKPCRYEASGCQFKVTQVTAEAHESECDFRIVPCIVGVLKFNCCSWKGQNRGCVIHLARCHFNDLGPSSNGTNMACVPFDRENSFNVLRVIEAFKMVIVFLYHSSRHSDKVRFLFVMVGKRSIAKKFYVKMQIYKDDNMIKFDTKLLSSLDSYETLLAEENCIAISHNSIQHYILNGHIHFRYSIKTV